MLALALLPTLSRSAAWWRGDVVATFAQVCTLQGGTRLDPVAGAPVPQLPSRADASLDACAYCLQAGAVGVPSEVTVALPASMPDIAPTPDASGPVLRSGWRSAQPRAPPSA